MTYRNAYIFLARQKRAEGWSILHTDISGNDMGEIIPCDNVIKINKHLNWKNKLAALAHEIGHAEQTKIKKWHRFYKNVKLPDTPKNRRYVIAAEIDASKRAHKLLMKIGIDMDYDELDPECVRDILAAVWIKSYITIKEK